MKLIKKILLTQLSVVKIVFEDQKEETYEDNIKNDQQNKVVKKESSPKIEVQNKKDVKVEQEKREDKMTQKEEKEEKHDLLNM